jgi:hypothetical protein
MMGNAKKIHRRDAEDAELSQRLRMVFASSASLR